MQAAFFPSYLPIPLAVVHFLLGRRLLLTYQPFQAMNIYCKTEERGLEMKIKISFSEEEREDARRLADMIRKELPQMGKAKETKKPEDRYGHIYLQDSRH